MNAPEVNFKIELNGIDATKDLTPYLIGITYTDHLAGKADELKIELDNTDYRFLNDWYMSPGMTLKGWIGQMYCGQFTIYNVREHGPPHMAEVRAQSALFNGPIRTKNSFSYYKKSLSDIVKKYANDHGLTIVGSIPDLNLTTIIQSRQSDIDFLHDLAGKFGCICSLKGKNLVFDSIENIWKKGAAKSLELSDEMSYDFVTSLPETADATAALHYDEYTEEIVGSILTPQDKKAYNPKFLQKYTSLPTKQYDSNPSVHGQNYTNFDLDYDGKANNVRVIYKKAESVEESNRIAVGDLAHKKNKKHTCNIHLPGDELLVSGSAINILGVGKRSGYWLIEKSVHHITKKSEYTTTIDIIHGAATTENKAPTIDDQATQGFGKFAFGPSTQF